MEADEVQRRLGDRLRDLRERVGYTQEQLAERCGYTVKFISSIERGKVNVPLITSAAIARALGATLSELVLGVDGPIPRDLKRVEQLLAGRSRAKQARILGAMRELLRDD